MIVPLTQKRIIRTRRVTANFTEARRLIIFLIIYILSFSFARFKLFIKIHKIIDKAKKNGRINFMIF